MSPLSQNDKSLQNKDLTNTEPSLDRETDSKNANQARNLPDDLAKIVAVWPDLPEHSRRINTQGYFALSFFCKAKHPKPSSKNVDGYSSTGLILPYLPITGW
ncbi:MAG: hypothetical protein ACYSW4_00110 [Planctomycetota bacterium]